MGGPEHVSTSDYPNVDPEVRKALDVCFPGKVFTNNKSQQLRHHDAPEKPAKPGIIVRFLKFKEGASSSDAAELLVGLKRPREGDGESGGEGNGESGGGGSGEGREQACGHRGGS